MLFTNKLTTQEKNHQLVKNYFQAINEKNWVQLESLLHDDFLNSEEIFSKHQFSPFNFSNNSWIEFIKLLGYKEPDSNYQTEFEGKKGHVENHRRVSEIISNYEINDMVLGDDKIWVSTYSKISGPNNTTLLHNSYTRFWIKDNKIQAFLNQGRFLATLLQYGAIVIKQDNQDDVEKYLKSLANMGLIPQTAYE